MAHRSDFTMTRDTGGQMSMCDVCASIIPNEQPRLRTFIGNSGQSDVCDDCANTIADLTIAERKKARRAVAV